ncbi:MAG: AAA family ATPase, partial [Muribaculaceae bacterium]|nr:AAA family ATPase [Muribaculaceae bacterium]
MARIKYPIGIQTFSEIISEGYLYVDKTQLVYDLVDTNKYVFLSRPRRFGKSLLMSTLEAYFRGERELFKGLAMEKLESEWETYPVFRFDLSGEYFDHPDKLSDHIHSYLDDFSETYSIETEGSISNRFSTLIKKVHFQTGKKIVILIDEYDKPLLDSLHKDELHGNLRDMLRGFYSVIKASDQYIRFAMLTGITKFSKVSVFSGLNNLEDISMLSTYNDICGISETEFRRDFVASIANFSIEHDMEESRTWEEFKTMYDGYHFASRGEGIYNPFSVLNAFKRNEFGNFWYESGSPSYLVNLIERHNYSLDRLEGEYRSQTALNDISDMGYDIVPLLY